MVGGLLGLIRWGCIIVLLLSRWMLFRLMLLCSRFVRMGLLIGWAGRQVSSISMVRGRLVIV